MYQTPTVTTFNPKSSADTWRNATLGVDQTKHIGSLSDSSFRLTGSPAVGNTLNYIHWTADSEI